MTARNGQGVATATPDARLAMPEFLTRRDLPSEAWTVKEGLPLRGEAVTDIGNRVMTVPVGSDAGSRVIRAHEMMHAKVSPASVTTDMLAYIGATTDMQAVTVAEEQRVNMLVKSAGFDLAHLADGSEKVMGQRLAQGGTRSWNSIVQAVVAMHGTKALNTFIAGIRSVDPDLATLAKMAQSKVSAKVRELKKAGTTTIASTEPLTFNGAAEPFSLPRGFVDYTLPMANFVHSMLLPEPGEIGDGEGDRETLTHRLSTKRRSGGAWATPVLDKDLPLTRHVDGRIGRKRIASATGRNPRHMERLLTDPERRVFDRRSRGKGGVVLIDQSGSMSLGEDEINEMIAAAPGCVIIGYSHSPGDTSGAPNIWILANRGKVAEKIRRGNGGNGVDGPALRFALSMRRSGEPFIWCCDGTVTDANDQVHDNLDDECAGLVVKHRIFMAYDAAETVAALKRAATGSLPMRAVGNIRHTETIQQSGMIDD